MSLVGDTFWFLKRPSLYPELGRKLVRRAFGGRSKNNDSQQLATEWCNQKSISVSDAISLFNPGQELLSEKFEDEFKFAERMKESVSVKMGGAGLIDVLFAVCESRKAQSVLETGVAYGWSSLAVLLSLSSRNGKLVSVDMPYPGMENEKFVGCVVPPELRDRWQLIRLADREGIPKATRVFHEYDVCHYDSDKSYEGRVWAYPKLWANLKVGGVFMSDDISDNVAFMNFANSLPDNKVFVVRQDSQYLGVILK